MILNRKVLWMKVWGIAAVQGATTLTWVIYSLYFPLLLVEFGFSKELALLILIIENALESIAEPVFGALSDRQAKISGSKMPLISAGIILSSLLFIIFPCLTIFGLQRYITQWSLPILAIIWAGAMAIFRAPTISLLGRCAKQDNLPQAASILTLVGSLVAAFRFDTFGFIINLGAGFAFALGSFSLLTAGFILSRLNTKNLAISQQRESAAIPSMLLCSIFITGIWISWSLRLINPTVSDILKLQFGSDYAKLAMTIYLVIFGLSALLAGKIASRFKNQQVMTLGIAGTIISLVWLALFPNNILLIICLILSFSVVINGITPLILTLVPQAKSGLGLGLYFGGFGAGMSSFDLISKQVKISNFETSAIAAIAILAMLFCWLLFLKKQSKLISI